MFQQQLAALQADPSVDYAEPNYRGHFSSLPVLASALDDIDHAEPWWQMAVGAQKAWSISTGKGVTIAVIDSGVDFLHPDLKEALRSDGFNFGDCQPKCSPGYDTKPQDALGHGTFIAGIIAARHGEDSLLRGLAPDAKILPIKINPGMMDDFTAATLAQAIDYATEHGANIINLSVDLPDAALNDKYTVGLALQRAMASGVIVVAASGNGRRAVTFPGTYAGVITIAGTNPDGELYPRSNLGPEVVLAAPACEIESTLLGGGFGRYGDGTSFAAPIVAATIADILEIEPHIGAAHLVDLLVATATPMPPPKAFSFGFLSAGRALMAVHKEQADHNARLPIKHERQ